MARSTRIDRTWQKTDAEGFPHKPLSRLACCRRNGDRMEFLGGGRREEFYLLRILGELPKWVTLQRQMVNTTSLSRLEDLPDGQDPVPDALHQIEELEIVVGPAGKGTLLDWVTRGNAMIQDTVAAPELEPRGNAQLRPSVHTSECARSTPPDPALQYQLHLDPVPVL